MPEKTNSLWNEFAAKAFKMIAPFLIGALVTMWYSTTGDHAQVQQNAKDIAELRQDMKDVKGTYATNKRVDDIATEMRNGFSSLDDKVDQILKLMITRR